MKMTNKLDSVAAHLNATVFVGQLSLKESLAVISLKDPVKYSWEMGHLTTCNMETFNHISAGVSMSAISHYQPLNNPNVKDIKLKR